MYIYLSKKLSILDNIKIHCIAWNKEDGYIAVGGENGLLRVLKLDSGNENGNTTKSKGLAESTSLSMNQALEAHLGTIQIVIWNETFLRLTSSDEGGTTIVWALHKDTWYQEMMSAGNEPVAGMAWSTGGSKVCIAYESGAVCVASVEGTRIWGKGLKLGPLSNIQWSPDEKLLLIGWENGKIRIYDDLGNFMMPIEVSCLTMLTIPHTGTRIANIHWYDGQYGHVYASCPTIAICYEGGRMQLMRNESDPDPVLIDTRMTATHCSWNHNGSLLVVAGKQLQREDSRSTNLVKFFNSFGEHLRTLPLPGENISNCSWEAGSFRIALAIDSSIYFANVRPEYTWCHFKNTVVYRSCCSEKDYVCVSFWNTANNQSHVRQVSELLALAAFGEHCVMAIREKTENSMNEYGLLLCNTLGIGIDEKYTDIEVKWLAMNSTHVIAASKSDYLLWKYRTPKATVVTLKHEQCQIYNIDCDPDADTLVPKDFKLHVDTPTSGRKDTYDPICCIAASDKYLFIGKESGTIKQFLIPHVLITNKYSLAVRPQKISINCNSTRLSVIDVDGVLTVLNISDIAFEHNEDEIVQLKRKNVWAMCWDSDNPKILATVEKTTVCIFNDIFLEESISSTGYICSFQNLEIQAVLLDQIIGTPVPPTKGHLLKLEIKVLRDTRQLLEKNYINEATQFIKDNPHPRLWDLLGKTALQDLNLRKAEEAFVRSQNYFGILLVKKLQTMTNDTIRKASVAAYFKNFQEAEKLYAENDRRDLAFNLRKTLGDWFRVIEMMKTGFFAPDKFLEVAYNYIGDYFANINNWSAALQYYKLARNKKKMVESFFHLQDYISLESLMGQLEHKDPLLKDIARIFTAEGYYAAAIQAHLKVADLNAAIRTSILHHHWDQAIYIAKKYRLPEVAQLFLDYTKRLIKQKQVNRAVEINVQAKYWFTAGKLAIKWADMERSRIGNKPIKLKRLYVYAARLIELHKKEPDPDEHVKDSIDLDLLENNWRGAEAFHFYVLAHQQLYKGKIHDALCTSYKLQNYTSHISAEEVCCLLAFVAFHDGAFDICSRMFTKLESMENLSIEERDEYEKVAIRIFTAEYRDDLEDRKKYVACFNCNSLVEDWQTLCPHCEIHFPTCVATGRSVIAQDVRCTVCSICHHMVVESHLGFKRICPLCHSKYKTFD